MPDAQHDVLDAFRDAANLADDEQLSGDLDEGFGAQSERQRHGQE